MTNIFTQIYNKMTKKWQKFVVWDTLIGDIKAPMDFTSNIHADRYANTWTFIEPRIGSIVSFLRWAVIAIISFKYQLLVVLQTIASCNARWFFDAWANLVAVITNHMFVHNKISSSTQTALRGTSLANEAVEAGGRMPHNATNKGVNM